MLGRTVLLQGHNGLSFRYQYNRQQPQPEKDRSDAHSHKKRRLPERAGGAKRLPGIRLSAALRYRSQSKILH